jgi:hypothetical protein
MNGHKNNITKALPPAQNHTHKKVRWQFDSGAVQTKERLRTHQISEQNVTIGQISSSDQRHHKQTASEHKAIPTAKKTKAVK